MAQLTFERSDAGETVACFTELNTTATEAQRVLRECIDTADAVIMVGGTSVHIVLQPNAELELIMERAVASLGKAGCLGDQFLFFGLISLVWVS